MAADPPRDPDPGAPDARAVRRHFARAAATYDAAAVLQREVGARMAERLDVVKLAPAPILDAGCGTGRRAGRLRGPLSGGAVRRARHRAADARGRAREGRAAAVGARAGLRHVHGRARRQRRPLRLRRRRGAAVRGGTFDLVWSNLALQWVGDLPPALAELNRTLRSAGS